MQAAIVDALRLLGCTVLVTTVRGWRGPRGYGATPGVPDLLVARDGWFGWLGLEVKRPGGRISPAQAELERRGLIVVVRSVEDAIAAVAAAAPALGRRPGETG